MKIDKDGKKVAKWGIKVFTIFLAYLYGDYSRPFVDGISNLAKINVLLSTLLIITFLSGFAYFTEEDSQFKGKCERMMLYIFKREADWDEFEGFAIIADTYETAVELREEKCYGKHNNWNLVFCKPIEHDIEEVLLSAFHAG